LGSSGVKSFLQELQRDSNIVTVVARNDFPYKGRGLQPLIEREYWLRVKRSSLKDPALAGRDDFIILHVHYAGDWNRFDDQATFDRKRSTMTQINARHTCDGSGAKFHKPCQDPGGELDRKWREERGTPVLGKTSGLKWKRIGATKPAIGWELRNPKLEKALSNTLGLKWLKMGNTEPTDGRKLLNSKLADSLTHTTNFTRQEWENFSIKGPHVTHFVQAGGCYFKPACESDFTTQEWEAFGIDDLRDDNYNWGGNSYFKPAGSDISPDGWKWRDPAQRNFTDATPCLQDLLQKGERCTKVVRHKYVDLVAAHSQDAPQSDAAALGAGAGNAVFKSTAAGASATAEEYIGPDWSALGRPDEAPWPLTILFVGVDNGDKSQPDLNLKLEFEKIEQAYRESKAYHVDTRRVVIKQLLFSQWSEVMMEICKEMPTALHLGCHAHKGGGLQLFRQTVKPREILQEIMSWNRDARSRSPPRPEIRLIVLNACESETHALDLTRGVDFAIGHWDLVDDGNALRFSRLLYDRLFDGTTLLDSFSIARSCCKGYRLLANKDPGQFRLVPASPQTASPRVSETASVAAGSSISMPDTVTVDSDCNELVRFLKDKGLSTIAAKFSRTIGMELVEDLGMLQTEDLEGPDFSFLRRWHKQKLVKLIWRQRPQRQLSFWRRHGKPGRRHKL